MKPENKRDLIRYLVQLIFAIPVVGAWYFSLRYPNRLPQTGAELIEASVNVLITIADIIIFSNYTG